MARALDFFFFYRSIHTYLSVLVVSASAQNAGAPQAGTHTRWPDGVASTSTSVR
jgi:hypothetical protein